MIYPNSVPEFRWFESKDGIKTLQVRYVCHQQGYVSSWNDVPVVQKEEESNG